jgi:hypothetical protein
VVTCIRIIILSEGSNVAVTGLIVFAFLGVRTWDLLVASHISTPPQKQRGLIT